MNIMVKKIIRLAILGLFIGNTVFAQQKPLKHEMSVWGMGGLSTLKYDLRTGNHKDDFGGGAGIGYTYYFSKIVGLNAGIEFTFYNSKSIINHLETSYMTQDFKGTEFLYKSAIDNYEEKQRASYFNIPIQIQVLYPIGAKSIFIAGGFKLGIPLSGNYKSEKGVIKTTGYYKYENHEYEDIPALGFSTYSAKQGKEDYDVRIAYILSLEGGMKWRLPDNLFLYTGLYFDYGLNDIGKADRTNEFVQYNIEKPSKLINNGLLTSQFGNSERKESFTNKIYPMAFGVKVRLAFNLTN